MIFCSLENHKIADAIGDAVRRMNVSLGDLTLNTGISTTDAEGEELTDEIDDIDEQHNMQAKRQSASTIQQAAATGIFNSSLFFE